MVWEHNAVRVYTEIAQGQAWIDRFRGSLPHFVCLLGFTDTALIPNISAAGATPESRRFTAIADTEFLYYGAIPTPRYPLPPLQAGASPVLISRAVVEQLSLPLHLFNTGLPIPPNAPTIDLQGQPARCLSSGQALAPAVVAELFQQGLTWGEKLAIAADPGYLILSECVVAGTTTALGVLTGLGWEVAGKVNSSHPICNHQQKWQLVQQGLSHAGLIPIHLNCDPLRVVAAVGDPMQVVAAGMAIAASRITGVLLAGGTQMLAVYALAEAIARYHNLTWHPEQVVVGTTRWVAEDPTGDTIGLAELLRAPLLATTLSFAQSHYPQLQAYEQGFVKEGVGAGGAAIAASLYAEWGQAELLDAIEAIAAQYAAISPP